MIAVGLTPAYLGSTTFSAHISRNFRNYSGVVDEVGNFMDQDISILRVDGDQIVNTGKSLQLPGHPASMRGRTN